MSTNVYIADSDSTVGDSIQFLLASDNVSARVFTRGLELLACTRDVAPRCIVVEAVLPDISALSLLNQLRCDGLHVPVIILSNSGNVSSALEASRTGAWDYLQKPFMQSMLLDSVHRAMRQTR